MNRLIIIGNGFDLAHGLPTKYSDFLNWYWSRLNSIQYGLHGTYAYVDKFIELTLNYPIRNCVSYKDLIAYFKSYSCVEGEDYVLLNDFFIQLNQNYILNWVDIEMFYKEELEYYFNKSQTKHEEILKLNKEFSDVRELFHQYITEVIEPLESDKERSTELKDIFDNWTENKCYTEWFKANVPHHLTTIPGFIKHPGTPLERFEIEKRYILCFNYTNTVFRYVKNQQATVNFIHGHYQYENHPIVFGYGDESDELFPMLEKDNINEYLEFTKSVSYLKTINYNNLMNFIESDNFIVEVMGHSLAISDRTLLKTIFENKKCQYIFMYYHERNDGGNDFFDKSVNISRHFTDKNMMRKKVAPEIFCRPLPQVKQVNS